MPCFGPLGSSLARPIAALLLAGSLIGGEAAAQQTGAPTPLRLETQELGRELGTTQEALDALPEGRAAAVLQNRITAVEEELRRLTGRVEEAEFHEQQTRERIDRLVADLDRRLAAIEQRPAPAPGELGEAGVLGGVDDLAEGEAAPDTANRGTIPRDALLGIPAPTAEGPSGTAPAAALEGGSAARFTVALDLLQSGDFAAAEAAFSHWVEDFPDDQQAPAASYWLGEAQLAQGDHANAAATFAANYRTFGPDAQRAADNLLKLGTALAAMGDTSRACQTFTELDRRYQNVSSGLRQALERERNVAGCG